MTNLINLIISPVSSDIATKAFLFLRVGIGILTMFHGWPKIKGGITTWRELGTFVLPMGITFLLTVWGFMGACTEFFGGIALIFGFGTRIASICLIVMMFVATVWHLNRGDSFNVYSFPLSLIVVYLFFLIVGSGQYSLDNYFYQKNNSQINLDKQ